MTIEKSEEETALPRTTVDRIIIETINSDKITAKKESKLFVRDAGSLFLSYIATKANQILEKQKKKTLKASQIYSAMQEFQFTDYIKECEGMVNAYEEYNKMKPSKQNKFKDSGLTLDELHEEQMKLFSQAKLIRKSENMQETDLSKLSDEELIIENIEEVEDE